MSGRPISRLAWRFGWLPVLWAITASEAMAQATPLFKGGATCTFCHSRRLEDDVRPFHRDLILLNEGTILRDLDKHALAYKVLEGPLGQAIGRRLGWKVTEDQRCLSCHANLRADVAPVENFGQVVQEGVGCEACHGPGSLYELLHQRPDWRTKSPAEKAALGMVDVRNPIERVRQCASCHVGDAQQGKVVTHEMYAAGHPPLPPFEAAAFAEQMPRHWRYLCEKGALQNEAKFLEVNFGPQASAARQQLPVLREVLLGDLMAAISALRLESKLAEQTDGGLDLVLFDCAACHHELRYPSWRQQRGYQGYVPGRPVPADSYLAVVPAVIEVVAKEAGQRDMLLEQWEAMKRKRLEAFTGRPLGDPAGVATASSEIADWLEKHLLPLCQSAGADSLLSEQLLARLVDSLHDAQDYASARLLGWTIWALVGEQAVRYPEAFRNPDPLPAEAEALQERVSADLSLWQEYHQQATASRQAARQATLGRAELDRQLALVLPAGQKVELTERLAELLEVSARFDPQRLRQSVGQLREMLGGSPSAGTSR
ncbi:MAG: hypothetical protein KatS3mg110_0804 [Pirellulaceae bacterium]|nr:MAG: hypothetical protein KatS3mg110_0804 [Pirellulaceae bacterium]